MDHNTLKRHFEGHVTPTLLPTSFMHKNWDTLLRDMNVLNRGAGAIGVFGLGLSSWMRMSHAIKKKNPKR